MESWDEVSGKKGSGKKFCHSVISGTDFTAQSSCVATVTPVIQHCMGSLGIDEDSAVLGSVRSQFQAPYGAREVIRGVHGNNRLGGKSLLDCVVFGRVT